jgi:hemerythrin
MNSFSWKKSFEIGISDVDSQHKKLVELVNNFGDILVSKEEIQTSQIDKIFYDLVDYTRYHFKEEELVMQQNKIDKRHLEHHIIKHKDFLQEVLNFKKIIETEKNQEKQLLNFLINWLVYHILGEDKSLARQIKYISSGMTPEEAFEQEEKNKEKDTITDTLIVALNELFDQVSQRNKELLKLNQSLEEKVLKRTQELYKANKELEKISLTDVLTGLPNRRHAMKSLSFLWDESLEENTDLVCIMIDADHFKEINDTHGHDAGDLVLFELAKTLKHNVRTDDIVCRLGGDEFFVICPKTDLKGGMKVGQNLHQKVNEMKVKTGDGFWIGSISVGVGVKTSTMQSFEEVIKVADESVYLAKKSGKNCVKSTLEK